ncbi:MAG: hypothetical protein AB1705_12205, partial [Verrucomicrobiota bacterium]
MPVNTNPLILEKLQAFDQRRRDLILFRGIAEGLVTLLAGMTFVALVDWIFIVPEAVRWLLSGVAYAATAAVAWFGCARHLMRRTDLREAARQLEKLRPDLREDLLSAVELGDVKPEARWDSPAFRALLQDNVAQRVQGLEVFNLLPGRLISNWLYAGVFALLLVTGLLLKPGLGYDRMMARAFAPMADVERVSRVKITVVQPKENKGPAPRGDNLEFLVRISGPDPDKVVLELFRAGEPREDVVMSEVPGGMFSATAPVNAERVEFRVRAGDGITRKHVILTRARPQVVQFEKTYQYPGYSKLPPRTVSEENGDLSALEGSQAVLKIKVDQAVEQAELRLHINGQDSTLPLAAAGPQLLEGRVPIQASGTYSVYLVAAQSGFANKFSPQYEIKPVPDLLPQVTMEAPGKDLVVRPDEVVAVRGTASDDLALTSVQQLIRVNEGQWTPVPLSTETKTSATVSRQWDLLALNVNPGDRIITKLVAADLKGNRGESMPVNLVVGSPGFEAAKLRALEAKRDLNQSLTALQSATSDLRKALTREGANNLKQGEDLARQQTVANAQGALEETGRALEGATEKLKEALQLAEPGREASDLALVGQMLSQIQRDSYEKAQEQLAKLGDTTQPRAEQTPEVREATDAANRAADRANQLQQMYNDILSAEESSQIASHLNYLKNEQQQMNKQALAEAQNDPRAWERLARKQGGATREARLVEDQLQALAKHMPQPFTQRTKKVGEGLQSTRGAMEKSLAEGATDKRLQAPASAMQKGVENALANLAPIEKELGQRSDKARENLAKLAGATSDKIERVRQNAEQLAQAEKRAQDAAAKGQSAEQSKQKEKADELKDKLGEDWKSAVGQLKDRAMFEELRRDADSQFVSDMSKTAQALGALRLATESDAAQAVAPLKQLEQAARKLEAGHQLENVGNTLKQLADQERWEMKDPDVGRERPKDWNAVEKRMQFAANDAKRANLPAQSAQAMTAASQSEAAKEVDREMDARANQQRPAASVSDRLNQINEHVRQAREAARPALAEARQLVDQSAPKLSEMMAGLARTTEQTQAATTQAAQSNDVPRDEPRNLLNQQRDLNEQIEELKDALRRDANVQDITKADGRDRARDADDAVAMLREPPVKAEDALREAAGTQEMASQKGAMTAAAQQQEKIKDALNQLAKHYANMEAGNPQMTRADLRGQEEALGIKSALDAEYKKAENIAEMGEKTPEQMLAELERELARNEPMRRELDSIADQSLEAAQNRLQQAASTERDVARQLAQSAQREQQLKQMAEQARRIREDSKKLAEQEVPAIRMDAAAANADARQQLERAAQSLQSASQRVPQDFQSPSAELAKQLSELTQPLQQAQRELQSAAQQAARAMEGVPAADPKSAAAQGAQTKSQQAATRAEQMAKEAKTLADAIASMARANASQSTEAVQKQDVLAADVARAADTVSRGGRHESRLGTPQGEALQQIGRQTMGVADQQIPAARTALSEPGNPAKAQPAVESARDALDQNANALREALAKGVPPPPASASPAPAGQNSPDAPSQTPATTPGAPTQTDQQKFLDQ